MSRRAEKGLIRGVISDAFCLAVIGFMVWVVASGFEIDMGVG